MVTTMLLSGCETFRRRRVASLSFGERYSDRLRERLSNGHRIGDETDDTASSRSNSFSKLHSKSIVNGTPIHKAQASLFSSSSGWTNFRGLFNLAILLLFVSNGRVALENLIKYGILVNPLDWLYYFASSDHWYWPNLTLAMCSNITILSVIFMEKLLAQNVVGNTLAFIYYFILLLLHIVLPACAILWLQGNPLYAFNALNVYVIIFLKLVSYIHVNYLYRIAAVPETREVESKSKMGKKLVYPDNINMKNLYYFIAAPTLCYELEFPRSPKIRKGFLLKRFCEWITLTFIIVALYQQWVIPLLRNSVEPFSTMKFGRCLERVLKLAIPNHVIWLICFYTFFHSLLNFLAELLCFADRQFYLDFWNAETLSVFWKTWNIPVHRWAARHIFKPMIGFGFSKMSASVAVFFVSAFFHEYLVSVPLSMFRLWAFYGMISQIPLSIFTDRILGGGRAGNIVMWVTLIVGQPMAILMYVHDWYFMHYPHGAPADALLG